VVGENVEPGIYPIDEALRMATDQEVDLVEITAQADPPVVRVVDYSKFLYELKKKQKELKSKNVKMVVKEVRFGPNTDDHDFEFKLKHARKFLEEGSKVKAFVHFKGRTIIHKDRGEVLLLKFIQALEDVGKVESMPKLEGKRMFVYINPKGKNK
jgi:translation initiation factor IF-3